MILPEPQRETELSFRNLGNVQIEYPGNLGTYELLYADFVLFTMSALDRLTGETSEPVASSKSTAKKPAAAKAEAEEDASAEDDAAEDASADDAADGEDAE
jgi:hypothetical protein